MFKIALNNYEITSPAFLIKVRGRNDDEVMFVIATRGLVAFQKELLDSRAKRHPHPYPLPSRERE